MRTPPCDKKSRPTRTAVRCGSWSIALAGMFAASGALGQVNQEAPRVGTEVCANETCHPGIIDRKVMHGPAAQLLCMECHELADREQHLFRLTGPRRDLCDRCHTLEHDAIVHAPVADKDCTGCHDPHGSEYHMLLVAPPAEGLCRTCHEEDYSTYDFVHGPVAIGACVVCHDSHSSNQPNLLVNGPNQLCIDCHPEELPSGLAARHQHQPIDDGCTSCHDPHASNARFQLTEKLPDLCFGCHEGVESDVAGAAVIHGPMIGEQSCVTCHNPHFSALPRLQRAAQPDLCLSCHGEPLETTDGRTISNMAAVLADNPNHHGPIREGDCSACHAPHAAEHFSLLLQDYPPEFYAPFETERYELCFSCHVSDLVLDASGTGLTGFRDGDQNLHWLHVNKEKGRTCRACHEVHASKRPFHMREAVPYGTSGWLLEIRFERTDNGGRCAPGCHKAKDYDRDAPDPGGEHRSQ